MSQLFTSNTSLDAWHTVSTMLLDNGPGDNLLIEILDPCNYDDLNEWLSEYCPSLITGDKNNQLNNIINTIFPYKLASRVDSRQDLYDKYMNIYKRSRRLGKQKWGTYFQRLINYPSDGLYLYNQLENAINSLNGKSTCKNFITFHLTSVNIESNVRPIGAPCWQFGEIVKQNNKLNLVVVYRNHDYFYKAFGNFIGLSKLLQYICEQTKCEPGKLIVHSTHAYYNSTKTNLRNLLGGVI